MVSTLPKLHAPESDWWCTVDCVLSEVWRWGVPLPLGLPHRLIRDDIYDGRHIPAGTIVFANIWAMSRDPEVFPDPDEFIPERFSSRKDQRMDPQNFVFGFGKRACPGQHLAESIVWMLIVSMIATMDVRKAKDESGNVIEPLVKFGNGIFRCGFPIQTTINSP
jgi:cytochrome P450